MNAFAQGFGTGSLDRGQPITQDRGQNLDHLAVAIIHHSELASDPFQARR